MRSLLIVAGLAACAATGSAAPAVVKGDVLSRARAIQNEFASPGVGKKIDALGAELAADRDKAALVFDDLAQDKAADARILLGDLLVRCGAVFVDVRPDKVKNPNAVTLDDLGSRAAALYSDPDPFVRALAEWAVATRMSLVFESNIPRPEPDAKTTPWFAAWLAQKGNDLLAYDYVRQVAALGEHRTVAGLSSAARKIADRVNQQTAYALTKASPAQAAEINAALSKFTQRYETFETMAKMAPQNLTAARKEWLRMRLAAREAVFAGPDINFRRLVFFTRRGNSAGNITNGSLRDAFGAGGDLFIKEGLMPGDEARPLVKGRLGLGHFRGLDVSFDGSRAIFSFLKQPWFGVNDVPDKAIAPNHETGLSDVAHLYEVKLDGTGFRQLTDSPYNSDIEPCYLPNDDIIFCSDRSNYGSQCKGMMVQDKMIVNLYRCSPDGSDIRALSNNKDFDRHPHVMDNGEILFLHWEYQERHLYQTHTLWICRPDGSYTDAIYKQHIETGPMSLREARQIPGTTKLVSVACGHHNGEIGAIMISDIGPGINDPAGMRLLTPGAAGTEGGYGNRPPVAEGGVEDKGGHYLYPYPLSEKSFLVDFSYGVGSRGDTGNAALYYVDVWGNREMIHRDKLFAVANLLPVRSNPRPPVVPDTESKAAYATLTVNDVNSDMPEVKPGTIKYIRISQRLPWPCVRDESKACKYNDLAYVPAGAWARVLGANDWTAARVIGTVPVEADGSAHFKAPVDQPVFFQALDENYCEVRRMRSNVSFQKGEMRGCIGCHETKPITPPTVPERVPLAFQRPPSMPEPPVWGARAVPGFERNIQPIFDKHCISCHGEKNPKAGLDLSSRMVDDYYQSYRSLMGLKPADQTPFVEDYWRHWYPGKRYTQDSKQAVEVMKRIERNQQPGQLVNISDRFGGAEVTPPFAFGSRKSKLIETLLNDPKHKTLIKSGSPEWIALVTWVDLNAPYIDYYTDKDAYVKNGVAQRVYIDFGDPWKEAPAGVWIMQGTGVKLVDMK